MDKFGYWRIFPIPQLSLIFSRLVLIFPCQQNSCLFWFKFRTWNWWCTFYFLFCYLLSNSDPSYFHFYSFVWKANKPMSPCNSKHLIKYVSEVIFLLPSVQRLFIFPEQRCNEADLILLYAFNQNLRNHVPQKFSKNYNFLSNKNIWITILPSPSEHQWKDHISLPCLHTSKIIHVLRRWLLLAGGRVGESSIYKKVNPQHFFSI